MKYTFLLCAAVVALSYSGYCQGLGVVASIGHNTLHGDGGSFADAPGWRIGAWGEHALTQRLGLYADAAYTTRGGSLWPADVPVSGKYVCLGAMPRLKIDAGDDTRLVAGIGGYVGLYAGSGEAPTDAGLYALLGVEWPKGGASFFVQRGAVPISDAQEYRLRWSSAGFSVYFNLLK